MTTIYAQRQVRLAALAALENANLQVNADAVQIDSPGDWNTPEGTLPAILLKSSGDHKEGVQTSAPEFTTTVTLNLRARLKATSAEGAQDDIELLGDAIEQALFSNYALWKLLEKITSVHTVTEIISDGREHIASLSMTIDYQLFETYSPADPPLFSNVQLHLDSGNRFDPNGTYPDSPFPDSVSPAPRTSGPDGRDEGALNIDLPT